MSEPNPMPQSRDEMIRAVCEANGGDQNCGECICIRESISPCLHQAEFADDVLRWVVDARAKALEEAATHCENLADKAGGHGFKDDAMVWSSAAFTIRALIGTQPPQRRCDGG